MNKMAIDIAILPPDEVMDAAITINKMLIANQSTPLVLSKTTRLPHITLLQAVIDASNLEQAQRSLEHISKNSMPIEFTVHLTPFKNYMSFDVSSGNSEVQQLHERIMKEFGNLVAYDIKQEYCADEQVSERSLQYVRDFKAKHAYGDYNTCKDVLFEL